jgi:hypothetical protein
MTTRVLSGGIMTTTASYRSRARARELGLTSPLALSPGIYVIEPLGDKYDENDVVEPRGDKYDGKVRVSIKPGRVTEVWFASYRIEASGSGIKLEDREIFIA